MADDVDAALSAVSAKPFSLALTGLGLFGDKQPRVLWAGVARSEPLVALANKIEIAVQRAGLDPDTRKFAPHVTLAKLKDPDKRRLRQFLEANGAFASEAFPVNRFVLYSSFTGHEGAHYTPERYYLL
jgi:2'-5' RNA ligase